MSKIQLEIGVLNIAMHNHDKGELSYENLFKELLDNNKLEAQLDETHVACIGELTTNKKYGKQRYFLGQIYKYAKIDPERECLNTQTGQVATPEEKRSLVVPKHLRPHFIKIPFVFIPKGHRLYIQTKHKQVRFGITKAKKVLELLVKEKEIFNKFGDIEVTIQPDCDEVEKLINRKDIDKLILNIIRPNPDDVKSIEKQVLDRMKKLNIKKQKTEYTSTKDQTLVLDEEMKDKAKIAASNGYVIAEGIDENNEKWKTSTEEINMRIKTSYEADRTEENRGKDPAEECLIETAFDNHGEITK